MSLVDQCEIIEVDLVTRRGQKDERLALVLQKHARSEVILLRFYDYQRVFYSKQVSVSPLFLPSKLASSGPV